MLQFAAWGKWQTRGLKDVKRMREKQNVPLDKPYAMAWMAVGSSFDEHFAVFARGVGGVKAETYFVRTLQYAALHSAFLGRVDVNRDQFGPLVLSRAWHIVSAKEGRRVYDALLASGICTEYGTDIPNIPANFSVPLPSPTYLPSPTPAAGSVGDAPPGGGNGHAPDAIQAVIERQRAKAAESSRQPAP